MYKEAEEGLIVQGTRCRTWIPRGTSKLANQSVYYISGSIYHWFVVFPGKISCSICCQSHHIWKTKAPNNKKQREADILAPAW